MKQSYRLCRVKLFKMIFPTGIINKDELNHLIDHMKKVLQKKAYDVKMTNRLESHPCVVTVQDMASARHFIRTQSHQMTEEMRYSILQPRFEINPNHPLIKKLCKLTTANTELADRLIQQVRHVHNIKIFQKHF